MPDLPSHIATLVTMPQAGAGGVGIVQKGSATVSITQQPQRSHANLSTSLAGLVSTLQRLADATSHNLGYSYRLKVPVSYGEVTITESNLLELRRLHPDVVYLHTFASHQESKSGADWEWHIIGQRRTLKMRVQAKRVQRDNVLKIRHLVRRYNLQQRDLLIDAAQANKMRPMYCFYRAESQRNILGQQLARPQTGCLLADARNVPLDTRSLISIEWACWPWHYLLEPFPSVGVMIPPLLPAAATEVADATLIPRLPLAWDAPSILDLNEDTEGEYDPTGVEDTPTDPPSVAAEGVELLQQPSASDEERRIVAGVRGIVAIDVRSLNHERATPS